MIAEDEAAPGGFSDTGGTAMVQIVDLDDSALLQMREYDHIADVDVRLRCFSVAEPNALPKISQIVPQVLEWIDAVAHERLNFYSAREEQDPHMFFLNSNFEFPTCFSSTQILRSPHVFPQLKF